jgi:uncharacterized protein (TIGR02996 family)
VTEQAAFLKAIAAEPGDDVRRLGYADWLQENGQEERAEFIRAQIRLATPPWNSRDLIRSEQLLDRHRANWSRLPCPGCKDWLARFGQPNSPIGNCPTCGGTGDLFRRMIPGSDGCVSDARTVTFTRGFPESVSCTLGEVGRDDLHPHIDRLRTTWASSEWAKAVVRASPVVKFAATFDTERNPEQLRWLLELGRQRLFAATEPYAAAGDTTCALHLALGDFVRAEVYGKAVST